MGELLSGKTAVITGAASGIGRGIALSFSREGANVVVADIQQDPKEGGVPTHEKARDKFGTETTFVECDISNLEDLDNAMDAAANLGGIDIMVNNAALFTSEEFLETTEEEYNALMDVNVKGTFFGAQQAARRMISNGGGSIINISSINGIVGNWSQPIYCMSKGAVKLLTYSLAHGLGSRGVRVNAIHPGSIETQMNADAMTDKKEQQRQGYIQSQVPMNRSGQPAEIGDAAVFLASDLSRYVNGASLSVDGGWLTHN